MSEAGTMVAELMAGKLNAAGARGVALVGSAATGTEHTASDLDLVALVDDDAAVPRNEVLADAGRLVTVAWTSPAQVRRDLRLPEGVGAVVPGWRSAVALHDPAGMVAALAREAETWSWDIVGEEACDGYVAQRVTGLAEEVHKVVGLSRAGRTRGVAVNRALIVLQLAGAMSVHRRILYGSENALWDLVAKAEGSEWAAAQDTALGLDGGPAEGSVAALRLFALAAERVAGLLNSKQTAVVELAVQTAHDLDQTP
jgi:hypothetical protein